MKYLLDASAMLAPLLGEPGADRVRAVTEEACVSAANLAEVIARVSECSESASDVVLAIDSLRIPVVSVEEADGILAGMLRRATKSAGLSLGDRLCLATAVARGLIVVTADRAFGRVADAVDVEIELIR